MWTGRQTEGWIDRRIDTETNGHLGRGRREKRQRSWVEKLMFCLDGFVYAIGYRSFSEEGFFHFRTFSWLNVDSFYTDSAK